jgi:hypothetical protein
MLDEIDDFVYDPTSAETLVYQVQSFSLKKELSRKVHSHYQSNGVFVEYNRQSPECVIRKSKKFKQTNFVNDVNIVTHEKSLDGKTGKVSTPGQLSQSSCAEVDGFEISGKNTVATIRNIFRKKNGKEGEESDSTIPALGFCDLEEEKT